VAIKVSFESLETAFDQPICWKPSFVLKFGAQAIRLSGYSDCTDRRQTTLLHVDLLEN
jgi:hypothetical protein